MKSVKPMKGWGPGWYHNASESFETEVQWHEENPTSMSGNWLGPFKTFGDARRDAIHYYSVDRDSARYAIHLLRRKTKGGK